MFILFSLELFSQVRTSAQLLWMFVTLVLLYDASLRLLIGALRKFYGENLQNFISESQTAALHSQTVPSFRNVKYVCPAMITAL